MVRSNATRARQAHPYVMQVPVKLRKTILIVNDNGQLERRWTASLPAAEWHVRATQSREAALSAARQRLCDLIVVEDALPDFDLVAFVRRLRETSEVPLLATTDGGEPARTQAYLAGADVCLSRPVEPEEMWARVMSLLRRARRWEGHLSPLCRGDIELDPGNRSVRCRELLVRLSAAEYRVLELLLLASGQVVSRDRLAQRLRGHTRTQTDRSIDVHISRLRRRVAAFRHCIHTVTGEGYRFVPACLPGPDSPSFGA